MDPTTDVYSVLKRAMQVERDGYAHYLEAARRTEDLPARRVFMRMAADEEIHHRLLQQTYSGYKDLGEPGKVASPGSLPDRAPLPPSPIFSPEFLEKRKSLHTERSAISIGILLERNSIAFYQALLETADYPEMRSLLRFLIYWENSHLDLLLEQMRFLDTYYGFDTVFTPP